MYCFIVIIYLQNETIREKNEINRKNQFVHNENDGNAQKKTKEKLEEKNP